MIKKLNLLNFRNIESAELLFDKNSNLITGSNAQGKTNIVEAIGCLSTLKSFRGSENKSLIRDNCDFASIEAIDDKNNSYKVVITKEKKSCSINNNKIRKFKDFIGLLNVCVFSPDDVKLFKDSPSERREFLNESLSILFPAYYAYLSNYENYRIERNNLLKLEKIDDKLLATYDMLLSNYGKRIVDKRNELINELNSKISQIYQKLSNSASKIRLEYHSDFLNKSEKEINQIFKDVYEIDLARKQTTQGPHKDDLYLYIDDKLINQYGSQGQNRLAVISLKLATSQYIKEKTLKNSIVILDDVLSELDEIRRNQLLENLDSDSQIFITTTESLDIKGKLFNVTNGIVKEEHING